MLKSDAEQLASTVSQLSMPGASASAKRGRDSERASVHGTMGVRGGDIEQILAQAHKYGAQAGLSSGQRGLIDPSLEQDYPSEADMCGGDGTLECGPITLVSGDDKPKRIAEVRFSLMSDSEVRRSTVMQVSRKELHWDASSIGFLGGPLDARLGVSDFAQECETCGNKLDDCIGHFGYVDLVLPVFHIGYFRAVKSILDKICKRCGRVLVPDLEYATLLREVRAGGGRRRRAMARVDEIAGKASHCGRCGALNGSVKKMNALVLIHDTAALDKAQDIFAETTECEMRAQEVEEARRIHTSVDFANAGLDEAEEGAPSEWTTGTTTSGGAGSHATSLKALLAQVPDRYKAAVSEHKELAQMLHKASNDLTPLHVRSLLASMPDEDCLLLGLDPVNARPEHLVTQYVLAPPVCVRPSVRMDPPQGTNEDDVTMKLSEIVQLNNVIERNIASGSDVQALKEAWEHLQLQYAMLINSDLPGMKEVQQSRKQVRGFCQRLKGKGGRFRGNLSGKRVDFSSRTVISPDPNLAIDQVAVPQFVAMVLTYSERVTEVNKERMKALVRAGGENYPGANFVHLVVSDNGAKRLLKYANRDKVANRLAVGDIVERHLCDGDVVLFNRQPSLHRVSIMAMRARVLPGRTFRFNECVCAPFNADFDGDEMNLHLPQTPEASAEAMHLMGVQENVAGPRTGGLLVAATQDFLSASYLLSLRDNFFDRTQFCQLVGAAWLSYTVPIDDPADGMSSAKFQIYKDTSGAPRFRLPDPAVMKPVPLWTGKQVFSVLLGHDAETLSFDAESKSYKGVGGVMCPRDGYVVVRKGELLAGVLDKVTLGGGSRVSFFAFMVRDRRPKAAADTMARMARLCARYIGERGLSIGLSDVEPAPDLVIAKDNEMDRGFNVTRGFISKYESGEYKPEPGCTEEETLEGDVTRTLSKLRDTCGKLCIEQLPHTNGPLIMATCGSKGSTINISQMVACVGQQTVSGQRIPNGFERRSLPHFIRDDRSPGARGFVANSFYSGLEPTEFFFHTMGGREGLVDTAVKTAETGYLQRKMVKALEDLSVQYDGTVRGDGGSQLVQFQFGEDSLDPMAMEGGKGLPIAFDRVMRAIRTVDPLTAPAEPMTGDEIRAAGRDLLLTLKWASLVQDEPLSPEELAHQAMFGGSSFSSALDIARRSWRTSKPYHDDHDNDMPPSTQFFDALIRYVRQLAASVDDTAVRAETIAAGDTMLCAWIRRSSDDSVSHANFASFADITRNKLYLAKVEPGTAVGALAAQSIGEPATQMTLKTFHFAGVASMNVTLGVPRIREILNATKAIATPIITAYLVKPNMSAATMSSSASASSTTATATATPTTDDKGVDTARRMQHALARRVKLRIAPIRLEDVCSELAQVTSPVSVFVRARFNADALVENGVPADADQLVAMAQVASTSVRSLKYKKGDTGGAAAERLIMWAPRPEGDEDRATRAEMKELTDLIQRCEKARHMIGHIMGEGGEEEEVEEEELEDGDADDSMGVEFTAEETKGRGVTRSSAAVAAVNFARHCAQNELRFYPPPPTRQEKRTRGLARKKAGITGTASLDRESRQMFSARLDDLVAALPKLAISGVPGVQRVVISELDTTDKARVKSSSEEAQARTGQVFKLLVEGGTLRSVMSVAGVVGELCSSNDVRGVEAALGIEAARQSIIDEISYTMDSHSIAVDPRHTMLLADLMTCRGDVLGVNRYGISKMKESVLMLASFEKTTDHLFDAALRGKVDNITGVSESIIMGNPVPVGTGSFQILSNAEPWRSEETLPTSTIQSFLDDHIFGG
jgi:DNA-directed RNA polymerase III subunit RPC1